MVLEGVQEGSVTLTGGAATTSHQAIIDFSEIGMFEVNGLATRDFAGFDYALVDFVATASGEHATWGGNLTAHSFAQGNGVVKFAPGSWVATLVGAEQLHASTWYSEFEINGSIHIP